MSGFQNCKNVWGKGNRACWGSCKQKNGEQRRSEKIQDKNLNNSFLSLGPFGSKTTFCSNSGSVSLPIGGLSSLSSNSMTTSRKTSSGPNAMIHYGFEPKRFKWTVDDTDTTTVLKQKTLSLHGSKKQINIGEMVENIFKEEIGKMAESYKNGSFVWM